MSEKSNHERPVTPSAPERHQVAIESEVLDHWRNAGNLVRSMRSKIVDWIGDGQWDVEDAYNDIAAIENLLYAVERAARMWVDLMQERLTKN